MNDQTQGEFPVHVEGEGSFTFAKMTMRDRFRIEAEYARLTEGVDPVTEWLWLFANAMANLKVRTRSAPEGWDPDSLDPLEPASYQRILKVYSALGAAEDAFRRKAKPGSEALGQGSVPNDGVLVPPPLQPGSDRPAVS